MTNRTLSFALTRPRVFLPGAIGLGLLAGHVSLVIGVGLIGIALWQLLRLASDPALDDLLRLRRDKERHQVRRLLRPAEREEILALDQYVSRLRRAGADPALGEEVMARAWELIRDAGLDDAGTALRVFRQGLPTLDQKSRAGESALAARVDRELNILRAAQLEVAHLDETEAEWRAPSTRAQAERTWEVSSA